LLGKGIIGRILVHRVRTDQVKMNNTAKFLYFQICAILYSVFKELLMDKRTFEQKAGGSEGKK
jgi:hypothetical protein